MIGKNIEQEIDRNEELVFSEMIAKSHVACRTLGRGVHLSVQNKEWRCGNYALDHSVAIAEL